MMWVTVGKEGIRCGRHTLEGAADRERWRSKDQEIKGSLVVGLPIGASTDARRVIDKAYELAGR